MKTWYNCKKVLPQAEDLPIWWGKKMPDGKWFIDRYPFIPKDAANGEGLWMHAEKKPDPPPAPTQQELDAELLLQTWRLQGLDFAHDELRDIPQSWIEGFVAGLKAERNKTKTNE